MEQAGLLFESDRGNDQFVARYFFHHFLGADDVAWLAQFKDAQLSPDEAKALIMVREAGAIDNAAYRALNKVDTLAASAALRRLRDAGLLVQKGKGSATHYLPTERLGLNKNTGGSPGLSTHMEGLSGNPSALSSNLGGLSSNPTALSSNPQPNAQDAARSNLLDELPGSLAARLGALGQRHPPQEIQNLIVDLCSLRDWSVSELALLLRRNPEGVRQSYLRPLMRDGRLAMTNPEEPNDPQQAYRAVPPNKN